MAKKNKKVAIKSAAPSGKSVCIICGKERQGLPVKEDNVIRAIRWIKTNITKDEKNNALVICKECYPVYRKGRSKFTSRRLIYVGLGVLFLIGGVILSPAVGTILITLVVLGVLYLFALLNYMPDVMVKAASADRKVARS